MTIKVIVCIFSCSAFFANTAAFSLRDELSSYFSVRDDSSLCSNSPHPTCTTKSGAVPNAPCVFPFLVNNEKMWSCTTAGGFPDPWCATGVDSSDCSVLRGQWGDCDEETCDGVFEPTTEPSTTLQPACTNTNTDDECITVDGPQANAPCWFPFIVQGVTHTSCTTQGGYPEPWCATLVDDNCSLVENHWGNCDSSCPNEAQTTTTTLAPPPSCYNTNTDCVTVSGQDVNEPCWFPFKIRDEIHYTCTYEGGYPEPWCPTRVDQDCHVDGIHWGNCNSSCPNEKQSTTTPVSTTGTTVTTTMENTGTSTTTTENTETSTTTTENTGTSTMTTENTGTSTTTTENTGTSTTTTENTGTSTTDHTETTTTAPPTPEDCWYDYLCDTNINIGVREDLENASTCQAACNAMDNCNHFTWFNYHEQPHCWFLENCDHQKICSAPDFCKSGPSDCGDLPEPCNKLEYKPGDHIVHWVAFSNINPYMEPIPKGTTCFTSIPCDTWKNAAGPVTEVKATCQGGTNWTLFPPDVTYSDGSPFPKPSQGDPDC